MKKIFSRSLCLAFAGILAAACVDERDPMVVFDPEATSAPVLSDVATTVLTMESPDVEISYKAADYGLQCAVRYSLYVDKDQSFSKPVQISANISEGKAVMTAKAINSTILNLGGVPDEEFSLYFRLHSEMSNDQNTGVPGTELISNVASGSFVPYSMLVADKDLYKYVYVIGQYCNWKHADANLQYLYDVNADGKTYTGLIDFGTKASEGFKITGGADWDHGNYGSFAQAESTEQSVIELQDDGGSKDIRCYSKRFYQFRFDQSALTLTKLMGFDQMGLIGIAGDWNNDIVMEYNAAYTRFYADVEASSDTEFKFRLDGGWDTNWGGAAFGEDFDNIPLPAGNYRIYFSLNRMEYQIDPSMYGKEEPGVSEVEPEPIKPSAWSLAGSFNGWNKEDVDYDLKNLSADLWVIRGVSLEEGAEFKILADHDWVESYGGSSANSKSTLDPENPYDVFKPELGTAFEAGGVNVQLPPADSYDISFDYAAKTILVEEHKAFPETLYMIGDEFGNWDWGSSEIVELVPVYNDEDKAAGQFWTIRYLAAGQSFKFCPDKAWNGKQFNALTTNEGVSLDGNNCSVGADGIYMIHIDLKNSILHVEPARVYGIGNCFGGWDEGMEDALFSQDGKTLKATLAGDGELRMFAASSRATTAWWTREFVVLDGKIVYRGAGPDQERVNRGGGEVVTLDFNAGTATIE